VRRAVLRVLAHGLYVASDETPSRFDGRVTLLERLAAAGVNPPFVGVYLGRHAYLRGDFARAARFLGSVGGRAAERPKVLTLLGRALEKLGRIDEACSAYAASLAADRRQAGVHYRLGRLLLAKYVDDLPR
jgi:predicted Zn-dependent protease